MMTWEQLLFISLLLGCIQAQLYCKTDNQSAEFDYLMLVQQTPAVICHFSQCVPLPREQYKLWTLHGLWPTTIKNPFPMFCGNQVQFNVSSLQEILPEMLTDWPDLFRNESTEFWMHEWCKHGTCAVSVESLNNEVKFFTTVLNIYQKYNSEAILEKSGIVPADTGYKIDRFNEAFTEAIGVKPFLQCQQIEMWQVLYQITVCFDKLLRPAICDKELYNRKSNNACHPERKINYYGQHNN